MAVTDSDIADTIRDAGTDAVIGIAHAAKHLLDRRDEIRAPALAAQTEEERVAAVERAAASVWKNTEAAQFWMRCPHPALDRQAPIDVARTQQGAERVFNLLDGILFGPPIRRTE